LDIWFENKPSGNPAVHKGIDQKQTEIKANSLESNVSFNFQSDFDKLTQKIASSPFTLPMNEPSGSFFRVTGLRPTFFFLQRLKLSPKKSKWSAL
jgi:hypothetical protein